jgi:heme-degrading monooxygenase HmoA
MKKLHIAEVNIARMRAPLEDSIMREFVERLAEINALADGSPGFVWRLQTEAGNATYLRPYDDDRILFNLSVWESIEQLKDYTYKSAHREVLQRRADWFEKFDAPAMALWWVPEGHRPSVDEAKKRLDRLQKDGPTPFAFSFRVTYPPDEEYVASIDWTQFAPCPSV